MRAARLWLAAVTCVVFSGPAWPQESIAEGRVLGGHRFIPSEFVPGPFITTDFSTLTGAGLANATVNVSGSSAAYRLGALSESMRLQVAVTDWLALRAGASGILISGLDQDAALYFGASVLYNLVAGASAGWRFGNLRVAGSLDAGTTQSYTFSILSAIKQSLAAGGISASTLLLSSGTITVAPGAQIAYGFSPALGAFGHVQIAHAYQSSDSGSQASNTLETGGGASIDLNPVTRVPVGFLAAYNIQVEFPQGGGTNISHQIGGGVFYTGRPDLALGVEGRVTLSSPSPQVSLAVIEIVFGMHYFW